MKVIEAFQQDKPALSFEFFPPRTPEQEAHLFEVIGELKKFSPDFVSVTYGAMGRNREKSLFWVKEIKNRFKLDPVAHLTCVAASKDDILQIIDELDKLGVNNILALRGDPPEGEKDFVPPADGFKFAKDLVAFIKKHKPHFCLGAAGYPEKHPESQSKEEDIRHLKEKIDAGAEFIITQLFFDNRRFFDFVERCEKAGIEVPLIPGLMPITNLSQIKKMTEVCGASLPEDLLKSLEKHKDDPKAVLQIGAEQTLKQSKELLKSGVKGIHYFVMNQVEPISTILARLVGIS